MRIRNGGRPEFLHVITYRQKGHTSFDQADYRPDGEADKQMADNDPIQRQKNVLAAVGVAADEMQAIHDAAQAEMAGALQMAVDSPFPDEALAFTDVQDVGSPVVEAF